MVFLLGAGAHSTHHAATTRITPPHTDTTSPSPYFDANIIGNTTVGRIIRFIEFNVCIAGAMSLKAYPVPPQRLFAHNTHHAATTRITPHDHNAAPTHPTHRQVLIIEN